MELRQAGQKAVDMHFHTEYSLDAISKIDLALKKAHRENFGFAVTDHNEIKGALKAVKNKLGVLVVPGIEVTTLEGAHVLFYFNDADNLKEFYDVEIKALKEKNPFRIDVPFADLIERSREFNAIAVAPHPFAMGATGIKKYSVSKRTEDRLHGVEVINSYNLRGMNTKAEKWAEKLNVAVTAGSDAHTTGELANAVTCAHASDREEFLYELQKKKTSVVGHETSVLKKAIVSLLKEETYIQKATHEMGATTLLRTQLNSEYKYLKDRLHRVLQAHSHFHPHD